MTEVKVHKSGEDLSTITKGVKIKDNDHKIRIAGAVLRIVVTPQKYSNDYKLSIWLPNKTQIEVNNTDGFVQWSEFMASLVEAATGSKPDVPSDKKVIDINGFPVKVSEGEDKKTLTIESSIDPLKEDYKIESKKVETPTPQVQPTPSLPERVNSEMTTKEKEDMQDGIEKVEDWIARLQGRVKDDDGTLGGYW